VVVVVLRFDPFRDVDRLAEQLLGTQRAPRAMPMDLFRSGDHYVLACDLPGVDPGSVDLSVDGGTLTIRAQRTPRSDEHAQWLAQERPSGTFLRQLGLGEGLDTTQISATYENGVLTVTLPVAERAKPRRIQVNTTERGGRVIESHESTSHESTSSEPAAPAVDTGDTGDEATLDPGAARAEGAGVTPTVASPAGAGPGGTAQAPPTDGTPQS
jgi:HSP20 family protein